MQVMAFCAELAGASGVKSALFLTLLARVRGRLPSTIFHVGKTAGVPLVQVPFWKAKHTFWFVSLPLPSR